MTSESQQVDTYVNHPDHYGGKGDPYEAIKVIEAWDLGFHLGNTVKYIRRHDQKGGLEDLKKALWYLDREIDRLTGLQMMDACERAKAELDG